MLSKSFATTSLGHNGGRKVNYMEIHKFFVKDLRS